MLTYRALARIAVPVVPLLLRDEHQRAAHRARLGAPGALEQWARAHRDPTRPLAWFHASSVGEGLQARAIMDALRVCDAGHAVRLHALFAVGRSVRRDASAADWSGYLCYDRSADVQRMLTAAAPDLLVFTKLDLWPELATRAAVRGTRVAMAAATVSAASGRLQWPARQLAAPGYAALSLAMAIADDDARRLEHLGCARRPHRCHRRSAHRLGARRWPTAPRATRCFAAPSIPPAPSSPAAPGRRTRPSCSAHSTWCVNGTPMPG